MDDFSTTTTTTTSDDSSTTTTTTSTYLTSFNLGILAFLLVYVCLFRFKNPLQLYVKYTTYVTMVMFTAVVFAPIAALRPFNTKNVDLVAKFLTFMFKIFGIRVKLENEHYFKSDQPYVLVTNHQSSLDFMTMMNVWPGDNCTPLAKKELFYMWPFGFTIWLCGITFIDRLNPDSARSTIDNLAEKMNRENLRVWIFPEGTRSPNTRLLPFKKGAFHLAIRAQVPIVCVVTSSYANFYNKRERKFLNSGEVKVRVLPPFQTKGLTLDAVSNLTKHLQTVMQRELDDLNREMGIDAKYLCSGHDEQTSGKKCHQHNNNNNNNNIEDDDKIVDAAASFSSTSFIAAAGGDDNNNSIVDENDLKKTN